MSDGKTETTGSWALRVGTVAGIPIRVHVTFVFLLVWFVLDASRVGHHPALAALFLVALFGCVVLHELGHALMAMRFDVRTREIVLYPIGGVARLENLPSGVAELLIALAGPAVNLALFFLLLPVALLGDAPASGTLSRPGDVLFWLPFVNLMLCLFNLIPAFPMDGGRVLRAALSLRMPAERATSIATSIGQAGAIALGGVGVLLPNIVLVLIALLVFVGASQESSLSRQAAAVRGRRAREAMVSEFETLAPQDSLQHAADRLLATHQQDFPVVDAWGRAVGVLSRSILLEELARRSSAVAVLEVMDRDVLVIGPDDPLDSVVARLRARPGVPLIVVDGGRVAGMITLEDLAEFVEVSRAGRRAR